MSLNINGGALEWEAVIDVDKAFAQLANLKDVFSRALEVNPNTTFADVLKNKLKDLSGQAKIFQDGLKNVTEPGAIKQLNDGLTQTQIQIATVQNLLKNLNAEKGGFNGLGDNAQNAEGKIISLRGQLNLVKSELGKMLQAQKEGLPFDVARFEELTNKGRDLQQAYNNVNKELHLVSSNVAGLDALKEGFRGLLGGAEALAGTMGLFTEDQSKAEEITKNLISLMSILNGVEEVGSVIAKGSALNAFLRRTALFGQAEGAGAAAAGETALTVAETEGIAATEAATVAQEGLNIAMESNPVGILLAAVVGLIGAYEIYVSTIGKATQEEARHKAATEAMQAALEKSAEAVGKEQASLFGLVAEAQNENLTRTQRQEAIDEIIQKYPEYLSGIRLENVYTTEVTEAIAKQVEMLKTKAVADAAQGQYAAALKKVVDAQNELNKFTEEGAGTWEKFFAILKAGGSADLFLLDKKTEKVKDAQNEADGVLKAFTKTQEDFAKSMQTTSDQIQIQIDKFKSLSTLTGDPDFYSGIIAGLEKSKKLAEEVAKQNKFNVFDSKLYDEDKKNTLAQYQFRVDAAKKGTDEELRARRELIEKTFELEKQNQQLFDKNGTPLVDKTGKPLADAVNAQAKFAADIQELNETVKTKALKNLVEYGQSAVLALQAIGLSGSNAFFDAQEAAIKKAATAQIEAAKDNAGEIRRIQEQLALDLYNLDIQRQTKILDNQRAATQAQLDLVIQGSEQELELKLKLIDIAAQQELLAAGKNQDLINEIHASADKKRADLSKQFAIDAAVTQTNITISNLETQLAEVAKSSDEELRLKKQLVDQKANLDVENQQKQIKNEEELAAKIKEIYAKALLDKKKLDDEQHQSEQDIQFAAIDRATQRLNSKLDVKIQDPFTTENQKLIFELNKLDNEAFSIQQKIDSYKNDLANGQGSAVILKTQIDALEAQLNLISDKQDILKLKKRETELKEFAADVAAVTSALSTLAKDFETLNPNIANILSQFSDLGNVISGVAAAAAKGFKDPVADIQAATSIIDAVVNVFAKAKKSAEDAKKSIEAFYQSIVAGEIKGAEASRQAALARAQQNAKNLQGLKDEFKLLQDQQKANADQYTKLFDQLQQESFISGESTKKSKGSLLFGAVGFLTGIGATTSVVQQYASLAGKSYSDILDLYNKGQLTDKAKALFEQLQSLTKEGESIQDELKKVQDAFDQTFTGTTAQSIADSIKQGLAAGKRSVADFADDFQSIMNNALLSAFEANAIEPAIADFYKKFATFSEQSNGNLTADQIAQLRGDYNHDIKGFIEQVKQLQLISGQDLSGQDGANTLSGAIRGMSEQTADLLAGQFGGMRLTLVSQLNTLTASLNAHLGIQSNTAETVKRLDTLLAKIDTYYSITGVKIK
jgi:hypothetical protein